MIHQQHSSNGSKRSHMHSSHQHSSSHGGYSGDMKRNMAHNIDGYNGQIHHGGNAENGKMMDMEHHYAQQQHHQYHQQNQQHNTQNNHAQQQQQQQQQQQAQPRPSPIIHRQAPQSRYDFCKNHPNSEATRICLYPGCSLSREICDECGENAPHSSHQSAVVDIRRFYAEVELGLKEIRGNSPLMKASQMFEEGSQLILRHFQSMNNMLIEKSPAVLKVLSLIELTEVARFAPLKTFQLEQFVREVFSLFKIEKSGRLEPLKRFIDPEIAFDSIAQVFYQLHELENLMRHLHDDFAKSLQFRPAQMQSQSHQQSQHAHHHSQQMAQQGHPHAESTMSASKQTANQGGHSQTLLQQDIISLTPTDSKNGKNMEKNASIISSIQRGITGSVGQSKSVGFEQQLAARGLGEVGVNAADVLMDPAFLKRPRGRPKGSKCKRKGKFKGKFTEEEKLSILQEVGTNKSVQVVAEKYNIQNSLIRYWARHLKYELDPQTVSSRRPYRTFSRDQKKIIVQEAIKRRDIVIVAQEFDVNAQVLKRWILKTAQGSLQTSEMLQMINAVPNNVGEASDDEDEEGDEFEEEEDDEEEEEDYEEDNEQIYEEASKEPEEEDYFQDDEDEIPNHARQQQMYMNGFHTNSQDLQKNQNYGQLASQQEFLSAKNRFSQSFSQAGGKIRKAGAGSAAENEYLNNSMKNSVYGDDESPYEASLSGGKDNKEDFDAQDPSKQRNAVNNNNNSMVIEPKIEVKTEFEEEKPIKKLKPNEGDTSKVTRQLDLIQMMKRGNEPEKDKSRKIQEPVGPNVRSTRLKNPEN